jgi:hypothetical protein
MRRPNERRSGLHRLHLPLVSMSRPMASVYIFKTLKAIGRNIDFDRGRSLL